MRWWDRHAKLEKKIDRFHELCFGAFVWQPGPIHLSCQLPSWGTEHLSYPSCKKILSKDRHSGAGRVGKPNNASVKRHKYGSEFPKLFAFLHTFGHVIPYLQIRDPTKSHCNLVGWCPWSYPIRPGKIRSFLGNVRCSKQKNTKKKHNIHSKSNIEANSWSHISFSWSHLFSSLCGRSGLRIDLQLFRLRILRSIGRNPTILDVSSEKKKRGAAFCFAAAPHMV